MLKGDKSTTNATPTVFPHKNHITFKQTLNFIFAINSIQWVFKTQKIQFLIVVEEVGGWWSCCCCWDLASAQQHLINLSHVLLNSLQNPRTSKLSWYQVRQKCLNYMHCSVPGINKIFESNFWPLSKVKINMFTFQK